MTYRESLAVLSPKASWCPAVGLITTLLCVAHTHRRRHESGVDGTSLEVVRGLGRAGPLCNRLRPRQSVLPRGHQLGCTQNRLELASGGIVTTIPPRVNRRVQHWYDPIRCRTRHLVENYFCDIKQFRAVATRYNKLPDSYCAMVNLASCTIETRRTAKEPVYKQSDKFPAYNTQLPLALVA